MTKTGGSEYQGSLGYETDEPFGVNNGVGFNRIEGGISGPLAGRLTFALNGTLEGRKSVEEGFSSQDTPIFLQAGVDTTINQISILADDPSTPFDERLSADTSRVDVYDYAVSRGSCDEFAGAGEAGLSGADADEPSRRSGITTASAATASGCRPPRGPPTR